MTYDPLLDDPPAGNPPKAEAPKPRAAGSDSHTQNEDKLVAEIAKEDERDALDDIYEHDSDHEAPMIVIGEKKPGLLTKLKSPKLWLSLCGLLVAAASLAWLITPSRLWALNTLGLRNHLDITTVVAVAEGTPPMLQNATVTVNGVAHKTDDHGRLSLDVPYGDVHILVTKQGYETAAKDEVIDFDPFFYLLGGKQIDDNARRPTFVMKSVGLPLKFFVFDWLTQQPVTSGRFAVGDVVATPTTDGVITMTIPATDAATVTVNVTFERDYANTTLSVPVHAENQKFLLVAAGKDYFISKRTGNYGVYAVNLDGSNVTELIPGSVNETGDMTFSASPSGRFGVLASTREATKDKVGSLQQKLYIVDIASGKLTAVDTALTFKLADWSGDNLVYTATERGSGNTLTSRLASIDAASAKQTALAGASGFKIVRLSVGSVVYITTDNELRTVRVHGGGDKSLGTGVQQLAQTGAEVFAYKTADATWHQYNVNTDQLTAANTPTTTTRAFLASPSADGQTQLVIDTLDGTLALIAKKVGSGQETTLATGAGLSGPIHWVGNVAVFRNGSADFVIAPTGGAPRKITDISVTAVNTNHDYPRFN